MNPFADEVVSTIRELISHGSSYRVEELQGFYHPDLRIVKIDETGSVTSIDREQNLRFFRARRERGEPPLSTDAEFNYVEADARTAHVIVTRHMQMGSRPEKSVFSLHLVREQGRWLVIRETAFVQSAGRGPARTPSGPPRPHHQRHPAEDRHRCDHQPQRE